jgi:prolipoprotein diacylglyceryltransferase
MYPVLFEIGPLTVYSLGVLWALAAIIAGWIVRLELKRHGYDPELASGVVTAVAIANPVVGFGMTEYQWISLALVILGTTLLAINSSRFKQGIRSLMPYPAGRIFFEKEKEKEVDDFM